MGSSKQTLEPLSNFEWLIMNHIWDSGRSSAREVNDGLAEDNQRAYTTIQTYMERLVDKGYLQKEKFGLVNFYSSIVKRKNAVDGETSRFVDQVFGGSVSNLAAYLVNGKQLNQSDLKKIRKLLDEGDDDER